MDYRRKYLRLKEKENKTSKTEKKIVAIEKEEKPKNDNVYLQKFLQNTDKTPKAGAINLTSYNENLPSFRISIRDILSTEENKQKAINYVIQKRNEEKYGKKGNVINSQDNDKNNLYSKNNNNYIYNSNSKIYNKNDTDLKTNRSNININQKLNTENDINISRPKYSYYIEKRNKPYIFTRANENNLRENYNNDRTNNNIRNNYINKSSTKVKENNNNYTGRSYIIKSDINSNNNYNINIPSPDTNRNITKSNDKNYKKVKKYQIIRSTKPNRESPSPNFSANKASQENVNTDKVRFRQIGNYTDKNDTNNNIILTNKTLQNNKNTLIKKSYDLLPNFKTNVSIYYSKYSKKNDNLDKSKDSESKIRGNENKMRENENKIYPKIMFRDYKNFKISRNNLQLNIKKDNKFRFKNENKNKKIKNIKEKTIEINISGTNVNINNEMTNLKLTKKNNKNIDNLLFKDENELIDYINKKYEQDKKIELFNIDIHKNENDNNKIQEELIKEDLNKNDKDDELAKIKEQLD